MERHYQKHIAQYLSRKIILLSGPRQSGKTTLTKMLSKNAEYINFDDEEGRSRIKDKSWDRKKEMIIFDEIHKMPKWKRWLKGIYDTEGTKPSLIVTGSARLDTYKKVGDSLAGRYFHYRLHPLDVRELVQLNYPLSPHEIINSLMNWGGIPRTFSGRIFKIL